MRSTASGAAARIVARIAWSAARTSSGKAPMYSSMELNPAFWLSMICSLREMMVGEPAPK
jgi:hypothetical protein